ncbi:MAG: UDP-glucose 6-dehydrogenase [Moraxella sp.]|nr:UDP-glucose 6-dehydrogenase [Moraxella sp.]
MKQIGLIGINHESINTAIFLASSDWQVSVLASQRQIDEILNTYQFDRQLLLLWHLYVSDNKILLKDELKSLTHYWLFFDENNDNNDIALELTPSSQVLLSGAKSLNFFANFANQLATNWVYYVPFNFLKDGNNFNAFFNIELLLIGEKVKDSFAKSEILLSLIKNSDKQYFVDIKTIEFARASIMGMLATRLSFINEMARLADSENINIHQVQTIMGMDKRIGKDYLKAGWGFGGKTLPNELTHLLNKFNANQVDTALLKSVIDVNNDQKELIFRKFWQYFNGFIDNKTVVIWGAGYRVGVGLTIGSAIHQLLALCWPYQIKTIVYAVNTTNELKGLYGDNPLFELTHSPYDNLNNAHALFILNWAENEKINLDELNQVALPIFDGKNLFSADEIAGYKGEYFGIGVNCFNG